MSDADFASAMCDGLRLGIGVRDPSYNELTGEAVRCAQGSPLSLPAHDHVRFNHFS